SGRGVTQDVSQAAQYYLIAANQGSASAQFVLASLYSQGSGVDEDATSAVSWYRRSAEQGYPLAMHNLAAAYLSGRGVEQNPTMAYAWFQLALRYYPENAPDRETAQRVRDQLASGLSQDARDEAEAFAEGFEPESE
ncbi:MAG: tetratricopeptide repeat protein, partial [Micropepsaceae bacterium]